MASTEYYWAIIGPTNSSAHVYGSDDCLMIKCGHSTPPLLLAIQCKSEDEVRQVARMLQSIINSLLHDTNHTQILAAFNVLDVQTLLEDEAGFYAIVIGSPPGIHHIEYWLLLVKLTRHMYCPVPCIQQPQKLAVTQVSQEVTQVVTPGTNSNLADSVGKDSAG
ncbi:hypothetical protein EDC04DRAFT_2605437 [Pisolithus marmoratus]|nr:hypothetical protein EDC04DRAFT_2605437 [Pisolithus marmoratus]